jgi:hypothetical protein
MKLKVLAILLLLVVGGAALVVATGGLPRTSAAAVTYLTAPAQTTDVSDDIAATGSVAASTAWDLSRSATATASDRAQLIELPPPRRPPRTPTRGPSPTSRSRSATS